MARDPYDHVLGCVSEIERELNRIRVAHDAAVDAIRDGKPEGARQWLDEIDSLTGSLRREVRTSILALAAVRDREGM